MRTHSLVRPPGIHVLTPSGRVVTSARPRPGWWTSARPTARTRYAHLARHITVFWPWHYEPTTRYAVLVWCGQNLPSGRWTVDHTPLLPCLRCVGTREAAHLTGAPCAYACDLGCRP